MEGIVHLHHLSTGTTLSFKETYGEDLSSVSASGEASAGSGSGGSTSLLPAWQVAIHPEAKSWASTGQGAKVAFYEIEGEGEEAKLGACQKLIETGRGKFGMEVRYVSVANSTHGHEVPSR